MGVCLKGSVGVLGASFSSLHSVTVMILPVTATVSVGFKGQSHLTVFLSLSLIVGLSV